MPREDVMLSASKDEPPQWPGVGTGGGQASLRSRGLWAHAAGHIQVREASVDMRQLSCSEPQG